MEIRKKMHVTRIKSDGHSCTGCVAQTNTALCKHLPPCYVTPTDPARPTQSFIYVEAPSTR